MKWIAYSDREALLAIVALLLAALGEYRLGNDTWAVLALMGAIALEWMLNDHRRDERER